MYLDNNWVFKEYEGEYVIGSEKEVRFIRMVIFVGEFELVKWFCCVFLLSGKLCFRRDWIKCLFYGKVIFWDEIGIFVLKGVVIYMVVILEENFVSIS